VEANGQTVDFLLTPQRDRGKVTIDQSGSNMAAITRYNKLQKTAIVSRQLKYLNHIVEQDHRAVGAGGETTAGAQIVLGGALYVSWG
jgi:transposase-like protein